MAMRIGDKSKTKNSHHTDECRTRVEEEMMKHESLRKMATNATERQNEWLAKRIEQEEMQKKRNAEAATEEALEVPVEAGRPVERGSETKDGVDGLCVGRLGAVGNAGVGSARFEIGAVENPDYKNWSSQKAKYDLGELYSPVRMTRIAEKKGLRAGWSFDCHHVDPLTGRSCDFLKNADRTEAKRLLVEDEVEVLSASPPCTVFSNLQHMNQVDVSQKEWAEGCRMLDHAVEMCRLQMDLGRGFIFEHPLTASSWHQESLAYLMNDPRVWTAEVHMCAYGLHAVDELGEGLVMKPTWILTNIEPVAKSLTGRYCGDHRHVHLVGGKARGAAAYTQRFCETILNGSELVA